MSETVFLSNTNLQIASGSSSSGGVKVNKLISAPIPDGAVLNGVVMDQDILIDTIRRVWQENRLAKTEVTLILNSPQFRTNRIDTPLLADKKTTEYILRETEGLEYGRFQSPVTGWYLVSKDSKSKTQRVVYERAESDFVEKYVEIFEKAGLKLKTIHGGIQLAAELFSDQASGKTLIYMILDGSTLVTVFFDSGKYYYDATSRVFSQPGTPEFANEIYASISSIRQFMSAQHLAGTLKDVFFAGLTQPQVNQLSNDMLNIDSQIDISMVSLPAGCSIRESNAAFPFYVYPIAGLRKSEEKASILKSTKKTNEKAKQGPISVRMVTVLIVIAALLGIAYGVLSIIGGIKRSKLKEIEAYNNSTEVLEQVKEYDAMYGNMAEIGKIQGGVDILVEDLNSYPIPDSTINSKIKQAGRNNDVAVKFDSYDASTGVFSITASSPVVDDINLFVSELYEMDVFEDVNYTGYSLSNDESGWKINVVCTLASSDSAEEGEMN